MITDQMIAKAAQEGESRSQLQSDDKNTADRYVVFLDIMGFKDRVARTGHDRLLSLLTKFNRDITNYISKYKSSLELAQFSDSIVLFSSDDSESSLKTIAEITCGIMQTALKQPIPIPMRGAISQGRVTCDIPKQLFFGQSLIDAYLLEESVNYYGVLVHHTAEQSVIDLSSDLFNDVCAPLKCGQVSHYELSWYLYSEEEADRNRQLDKVKKALRDIRRTVSDAPRKYIDNTLLVINDITNKTAEEKNNAILKR